METFWGVSFGWAGRRIFQKVSRITSTGRFIPELDGLRAIAIGIVFVQHLRWVPIAQAPPDSRGVAFAVQLIANATIGVERSFVTSGFLLMLPFVMLPFVSC